MNERRALVIGGDPRHYHEFSEIGPILGFLLSEAGFNVTLTEDLNYFLPERVKPFDLILCASLKPALTGRQAQGLEEAVIGNPWGRTGRAKGFIGVHGASASFMNSDNYLKMLGGRFLTHPPMGGPYKIHAGIPGHPVTKDIADFEINDELYMMETYPPFDILLETEFNGFKIPIAWVKPYGLGRVCYISLGHGKDQLKNPSIEKFIINAASWPLS